MQHAVSLEFYKDADMVKNLNNGFKGPESIVALVTSIVWVRIRDKVCDRAVVASECRLILVGCTDPGFLHHVCPHKACTRALDNAGISSMKLNKKCIAVSVLSFENIF